MEIDKVCRLCANICEKNSYRSIFSKNENGQQLIQLIKQCLPILVYRTDPLSKGICEKCYVKLNEYNIFQKDVIKTQDNYKLKLLNRLHESPVKLYVDTLDEAYQPETLQITNVRSLRPLRSCASQIQVETRTNATNTTNTTNTTENNTALPKGISLKNITILTPSKINENATTIPTCNIRISKINEDGVAVKKRRLNGPRAGPRCKTKPHLKPYNLIIYQPLTLLQCALKQINRNFNLFDEICCNNSMDSFATEETAETMDTGSLYQDYDEYTPSPDMSTMDTEYTEEMTEPEPDELLEPEPEYEIDIDINAPAICNYCEKKFPNLTELAGHEITHIKVDLGHRVGTKEFNMLHTKLAFYFTDYLRRQNLLPPKEVKPPTKPITRNVSNKSASSSSKDAVFQAVATTKPIKIEYLKAPKLEIETEINKPVTRPKEKINYEDNDPPYDDDNSLLVPNTQPNPQSYEYKIENDEIFVNGILLRNMEKNERKACYKDMMLDGVKRKFCPLCRQTFKDNWSIENHYMSGICLYTCKWCGRKFKYHKELFESHLITHKGEPATKIFGPKDRIPLKKKFKNKRLSRPPVRAPQMHVMKAVPHPHPHPQKVEPIKIKQLMQKKMDAINIPQTKIKLEPNTETSASTSNEPYQAYFCRRCFKVFFNVNEYNTHIRVCCGGGGVGTAQPNTPKTKTTPLRSETRVSTPDSSSSGKRPLRACVKESPGLSSDNDSQGSDSLVKRTRKQITTTDTNEKVAETLWECGICCSSFPSKYSRNSHMRIHKGQPKPIQPQKTKLLSMTSKQELQQSVATNFMKQQQFHHQPIHFPPSTPPPSQLQTKQQPPPPQQQQQQQSPQNQNVQYPNLNPAVARLVQNNPHLTIRSYSKSQQQQLQKNATPPPGTPGMPTHTNQQHSNDNTPESGANSDHNIKRNYKCADCDEKFENKSILYYHKMNSCIVKRHYECAFCRKKFGTYDQYNTHMFYVHPE